MLSDYLIASLKPTINQRHRHLLDWQASLHTIKDTAIYVTDIRKTFCLQDAGSNARPIT